MTPGRGKAGSRPGTAGCTFTSAYLLLFLWLFAFTGLLPNHPKWTFADFWPSRTQTTTERSIERPSAGTDLAQARNILRQLDFRVSRPGHLFEIKADLDRQTATVQRIEVNAWGVMRILHTFTGVKPATLAINGSYYMWCRLPRKRACGLVALLSGWTACALFVAGLRLLT